jgi:hypothetical protein
MRWPSWFRRQGRPPAQPLLTIAGGLWSGLLTELHRRGGGVRESGAFLLARRQPGGSPATSEVIAIAYYDDLDAHCLTGGISLAGSAYDVLWSRCRNDGLRVVADVHTHPGSWVQQSHIDRANPMMAQAGHVALIIGRYALPDSGEAAIGMYRYLGDRAWESVGVHNHLHIKATRGPRRWSRVWNRPRSRAT